MTSTYSFKDKYSWFHWCFNRIQPDLQHSITVLLQQKLKLSYAIKILGQFPGVKLGLDTPLIVTNPMNLYAKVLSGFLVTSWMSPFYKQLPAVDTEWDHDGKMGNHPIYFNPQFFGQYGKKHCCMPYVSGWFLLLCLIPETIHLALLHTSFVLVRVLRDLKPPQQTFGLRQENTPDRLPVYCILFTVCRRILMRWNCIPELRHIRCMWD